MEMSDKISLPKRLIIETVNDKLKIVVMLSIQNIDYSLTFYQI